VSASFTAITRNARISPTKVRLSAGLIRGKRVEDAINILHFELRRGSLMLKKTLESAVANAMNQGGIDPMDLVVAEVRVDKGLVIKRFRPAPKGRAASRQKKCSHITVSVAKAAAKSA
jgi:large subunit ribosomal protein L22